MCIKVLGDSEFLSKLSHVKGCLQQVRGKDGSSCAMNGTKILNRSTHGNSRELGFKIVKTWMEAGMEMKKCSRGVGGPGGKMDINGGGGHCVPRYGKNYFFHHLRFQYKSHIKKFRLSPWICKKNYSKILIQ